MKRYASVLICVLFIMLASAVRHIVLPQAKSAAVRYGSAQRISAPSSQENAGAHIELDV